MGMEAQAAARPCRAQMVSFYDREYIEFEAGQFVTVFQCRPCSTELKQHETRQCEMCEGVCMPQKKLRWIRVSSDPA